MGKLRLLPACLLVAALTAAVPARAGADGERVIVGVRGGARPAHAERRLMHGVWLVRGRVDRLAASPGIAWAEPDRRVSLALAPNDPCYAAQSSACGNVEQWGLAKVGAPAAWDVTSGSSSVVVAVLDTGVQATHPDLAGKVIVGSNFSDSPFPDDHHGHGTHVAGTVAALTNNGQGVAGLGWNTRVRAIKVLDDSGSGWVSDVVAGINEAVATGAKVVNLSLADTEPSTALDQAVQAARQAGLVVVAAAGNNSVPRTTRNYPAAIDGVIGVAATDRNDALGSFSNRGTWVSIAAPGVEVVSTCSTASGNQCLSSTGYAVFSGTSMATPHVSAAAALIMAANPGIGAEQVRARLAATASPIAGTGTDFQWGRLDVGAAVRGTGQGYWMAARDGGIFNFGSAGFYGSAGGDGLRSPVVGMAASATRKGYWLTTANGGVLAYGDARDYGGVTGIRLNAPILGMERTPSGAGYWLVAADGGLFTLGDARFHGSTGGMRLNQPVVGMGARPGADGYWMVARDGGIFTFGDAPFLGSQGGTPLNQPVVGMAPTPSGHGYWLVASDGGIFTFGDAGFYGSEGGKPLNRPIIGIRPTPSGRGYWMVASDGGIFTFGDAAFLGSTGGKPLNAPIVGMG